MVSIEPLGPLELDIDPLVHSKPHEPIEPLHPSLSKLTVITTKSLRTIKGNNRETTYNMAESGSRLALESIIFIPKFIARTLSNLSKQK